MTQCCNLVGYAYVQDGCFKSCNLNFKTFNTRNGCFKGCDLNFKDLLYYLVFKTIDEVNHKIYLRLWMR